MSQEQHTANEPGHGAPTEPWVPAAHDERTGALQQRFARGLTWTFVDSWGSQLVALVIFAILAHLLTDVDFGLVALAMVFVSFAQLFVDQGLGDALVQRKQVTRTTIDTAFWVAVVTGLAMLVLALLLAAPLSIIVAQPALAPIIAVLSLNFLITSLSSVQLALLRRELRFRSLAIRRVISGIIAGIVGISAAYAGFGAWALVAQQLTWGVVSVLVLWTASPWRPGLKVSRADFRSLLGFGANVVGSDVMSFLSRNTDNLLVGAFLGAGPLGLYAVGYRILDTSQTLLVNTARKLVFPTFSRLQADPERLKRAYNRVNRALSVVIMPGYIGLALVAQEAVPVLFGQKWAQSGPVATTLFLIGPSLSVQVLSGALLYSRGRPDIALRFRLLTTVVHITGFIIAVTVIKSIVAVAAAFVIGSYLLLPLNLYLIHRYAGISIVEHLLELRYSALAALVMAVAVLLVKFALLGHIHAAGLLAVEVPVGLVVFMAALLVFERQLFVEVATVALQALPGGGRIGRKLHIPVEARSMGGRRGQRLNSADGAQEAVAEAREAQELDMLAPSGGALPLDPSLGQDADV